MTYPVLPAFSQINGVAMVQPINQPDATNSTLAITVGASIIGV